MQSRTLVIYHGPHCNDGFCAAWIARRALPHAEFVAGIYGEEPPDVTNKHVYLLDFSYPREVLLRMEEQAASLLVLDHHQSAEKALAGLPFCRFDMKQSGAMLAWKHFFPFDPAPPLVHFVQDRDLWRFALPDSREVTAALMSYPHEFTTWDALAAREIETLVEEGRPILRYQEQLVRLAVARAAEVNVLGHDVLAVNSTVLFSEVAGELARGRPFGIAYFVDERGQFVYSLRSDEAGEDVSVIAETLGGGGHRHSAGFRSNGLFRARK